MGRTRSTGIDVLRGALALWVFIFHLFIWAEITTGATGFLLDLNHTFIDVFVGDFETHPAVVGFIVLSGYCIHRNGLRHSDSDVAAYGIRRAFRILPVYFLATAAGVASYYYVDGHHELLATGMTAAQGITADGLLAKLTGSAAFIPSQYPSTYLGNPILATVMVEIWLYVFYAAAVTLLLRTRLRESWLWAGIGVAWIGGVVWVNGHYGDWSWWHNGSLIGFLPYWWLGAKLNDPGFASWMRRLLPVALVGWIALTVLLMNDTTSSTFAIDGRLLLLAAIMGNLIVFLDGAVRGAVERALRLPGRVGLAGYSIYAFHSPILIALLVAGVDWWVTGLITLASCLAIFVLYERPLWRLGRRIATEKRGRRDHREPAGVPLEGQPLAARPRT